MQSHEEQERTSTNVEDMCLVEIMVDQIQTSVPVDAEDVVISININLDISTAYIMEGEMNHMMIVKCVQVDQPMIFLLVLLLQGAHFMLCLIKESQVAYNGNTSEKKTSSIAPFSNSVDNSQIGDQEKVGDVQPWMLNINLDEALAVNFSF